MLKGVYASAAMKQVRMCLEGNYGIFPQSIQVEGNGLLVKVASDKKFDVLPRTTPHPEFHDDVPIRYVM